MQVVRRALERIHDLQPVLNAFTVVLDEPALASARAADTLVRPTASEQLQRAHEQLADRGETG